MTLVSENVHGWRVGMYGEIFSMGKLMQRYFGHKIWYSPPFLPPFRSRSCLSEIQEKEMPFGGQKDSRSAISMIVWKLGRVVKWLTPKFANFLTRVEIWTDSENVNLFQSVVKKMMKVWIKMTPKQLLAVKTTPQFISDVMYTGWLYPLDQSIYSSLETEPNLSTNVQFKLTLRLITVWNRILCPLFFDAAILQCKFI